MSIFPFKKTTMSPQEIFNAAKIAADLAVSGAQDGYPCGFAWVRIKPARGKFVKFLKDNNVGRLSEYGGYMLWSSDVCSFTGQNMYVKEEGCFAFAEVLRANGINAFVQTRLD